jgi:hypothetical protein
MTERDIILERMYDDIANVVKSIPFYFAEGCVLFYFAINPTVDYAVRMGNEIFPPAKHSRTINEHEYTFQERMDYALKVEKQKELKRDIAAMEANMMDELDTRIRKSKFVPLKLSCSNYKR